MDIIDRIKGKLEYIGCIKENRYEKRNDNKNKAHGK